MMENLISGYIVTRGHTSSCRPYLSMIDDEWQWGDWSTAHFFATWKDANAKAKEFHGNAREARFYAELY